ncbi:MAG: NADH-quinone oxidoreductase subunit NuoK [Verrucomicrobia bacterium]|nr:NADH-quinone oxidoreductase subunit NuoK [Verrucomicrobiota bacterium]MCF7708361.1 NADH-quinone oxidoreductase subunit NuoK [Verrucomicrobiota bacterium]
MNSPGLEHYLIFAALLFCIGLYGIVTRRNLIGMLMSVEIILNAAALNFVAFHRFKFGGDVAGAMFPLFIIAIAAAEAAVALAIILALFRRKRNLDVLSDNLLKN